MEPIPKLNRERGRQPIGPMLLALAIAASAGLLQRQLAAIYAGPAAGVKPAETAARAPRREDAKLFARATEGGLLRLQADGRIAVAPADLPLRHAYARAHPDLLTPRSEGPDWLAGLWDGEIRRLHQALHFSAAGRYVRQQVEAFNARQLLAAIRWRSETGPPGAWTADWSGAPLTLAAPLSRDQPFLDEPSGGWQPWQWVARWPALENRPPVRFRMTPLRPVPAGERLELQVIGDAPQVEGATVLASEPRCRESAFCAEAEAVAHRLVVQWREGSTGLTVRCAPLAASRIPELWRQQVTQIRREGERLLWREPAGAGAGASAARPPSTESKPDRFPAFGRAHGLPEVGHDRAAGANLEGSPARLAASVAHARWKRR
ncbi:MAG: hypothetical protein JNM60_12490 [Candidatus Competibacteraceae bacterium]|nr:hypothetical protein [Candidatus Competibacteraceae bacterium]